MALAVLVLVLVLVRVDGLASGMEPIAVAQRRSSVGSAWRNYRTVLGTKTDDNDIELVWSDPVLVEDFAYQLPVPAPINSPLEHRSAERIGFLYWFDCECRAWTGPGPLLHLR